jgi:tetratricopeptide (TPR) repeat protein
VAGRRRRGRHHPSNPPGRTGACSQRTAEITARGLALVREAADRAPRNAESWGALALARLHANYFNSGEAALTEARAAQADARKALALDPANVSAHAALAMAMPPYGNWLASENAMRAVLAHEPAQHEMCIWLSRMLARVGRMREALSALTPVEASFQSNPSVLYWQSYLMWAVGRTTDGDRVIDRALRLWPRTYQVWFSRFWTYAYSGRALQGVRMVENVPGRPPGIPKWNFDLLVHAARALHTKAPVDVDAAQAAITSAAEQGSGFKEIAVELLSALGRVDAALRMADLYFFGSARPGAQIRYSQEQGAYSDRMRRNTRFLFTPPTVLLRGDRHFQRLVEQIGLVDYWQRSDSRPDYLI